MNLKLAEALLRRKELQAKVDQLRTIKDKDLFEVRGKRTRLTDDVDDVVMQVPLLSAKQVTHEYDWYARQLRLIDAAIQQANWTVELNVADSVIAEYVPPEISREK
jgi:hypothetical protein